ncbi:MAG TPA: FHA domain-containing protein [Pyrinomonadaceae bacterium]|jgi:pSer/pThr/pTyr-binding forkhead associated (FHA) protein
MDVQRGTIVIAREDRAQDSTTLVTEGLRVGRLPECEVSLNHPSVSRLHAGINYIAGRFFLINLSRSSATTLNGRLVEPDEAEALADGDVLQIGPFFLYFYYRNNNLHIKVSHQFATNVGEVDARTSDAKSGEMRLMQQRAAAKRASSEVADALKVFWGKRTREKAGRPSPLHPRRPPRVGKSRFNWTPTRDLVRPWTFSIFVWGALVIGGLSILAWYAHANAFAPQPLASPHVTTSFSLIPAIATKPNAGSCTTCHTMSNSIEANCTSCHTTTAFSATVTKSHRDAGIGCMSCHTEHRGENFSPVNYALDACAHCHNDDNKKLYNGKSVHTPHGGTFGYPVKNGEWVWKGLDAEELSVRPEVVELLKKNRVTPDNQRNWRNVQFHGIHMYRVRVPFNLHGIEDVDNTNRVMSCSSCHRTGYIGARLDRESPRTTCSKCHTNLFFERAEAKLPSASGPSCTSCHVQHIKDIHWTPKLFGAPAGLPIIKDLKTTEPALIAQ